jgi:hypothetical protein
MMSLDNKKSAFKNRRGIPFLSLIILLNVCLGCVFFQPKHPITNGDSEAIIIIAEKKSLCEQWASKVKKDFGKDTKEYQKTNELYINAKAAFDGWIVRLQFDLTADTDINNSNSYKKALEEASEKSNAFVRYATELYQPSTTKSLSFIVGVLPSLSDAGIKVWQEYRKAKEEQRKEIKKDLDNLKWKAFDEI